MFASSDLRHHDFVQHLTNRSMPGSLPNDSDRQPCVVSIEASWNGDCKAWMNYGLALLYYFYIYGTKCTQTPSSSKNLCNTKEVSGYRYISIPSRLLHANASQPTKHAWQRTPAQ
jgi:hypothetical protein